MVNVKQLAYDLAEHGRDDSDGLVFDVNQIPGDVEVLQITVEDREELPVFLSASPEQILCIVYLFKEAEIKPDARAEAHKAMLSANISIPLSSFALVDDQYVLFGALSVNSTLEDVLHEIEVLSGNSLEAIDAMRDYLA